MGLEHTVDLAQRDIAVLIVAYAEGYGYHIKRTIIKGKLLGIGLKESATSEVEFFFRHRHHLGRDIDARETALGVRQAHNIGSHIACTHSFVEEELATMITHHLFHRSTTPQTVDAEGHKTVHLVVSLGNRVEIHNSDDKAEAEENR